jgi:hypothetical protein
MTKKKCFERNYACALLQTNRQGRQADVNVYQLDSSYHEAAATHARTAVPAAAHAVSEAWRLKAQDSSRRLKTDPQVQKYLLLRVQKYKY